MLLYCNKCFRFHSVDKTVEFYLSGCSHILCKQCVAANCPVCNKPYKPNKICKNMPRAMFEFFEDPQKLLKSYQQVVQFQFAQQDRVNAYVRQQGLNEFEKLQKKDSAMVKLCEELNEKIKKKKQRIGKMKAFLAFHERRKEQAVKVSAPIPRRASASGRDIFQQCSQRFFPSTPTLSTRSNNDASLNFDVTKNFDFEI